MLLSLKSPMCSIVFVSSVCQRDGQKEATLHARTHIRTYIHVHMYVHYIHVHTYTHLQVLTVFQSALTTTAYSVAFASLDLPLSVSLPLRAAESAEGDAGVGEEVDCLSRRPEGAGAQDETPGQ